MLKDNWIAGVGIAAIAFLLWQPVLPPSPFSGPTIMDSSYACGFVDGLWEADKIAGVKIDRRGDDLPGCRQTRESAQRVYPALR